MANLYLRTGLNKFKKGFTAYKVPFFYTTASLFKAMATIVVGIVIAKYITPQELGFYSTVMLFVTYANFLQGGVVNGLNLELPLAMGRGNKDAAIKLCESAQGFNFAISLLVLLIGVIAFFAFNSGENKFLRVSIIVVTVTIIFNFYQNYLLATYRSNSSFLKLSFIQLLEGVFNLFSILLIVYFAFFGLLFKGLITLIIYVVLLHLYRPLKVGVVVDLKMLKTIMSVGLPIFLLSYIESIALTADKFFLFKFSSLSNVGIYSFGAYSLTAFLLFSASIASYIYPKLTYNYGRNNDRLILWNYVKKITILLLAVQTVIFVIAYFSLPPIIGRYFPVYKESVNVMLILMFAGVLKGSVVGVNVLWSVKAWESIVIYQFCYSLCLVLFVVFSYYIFRDPVTGTGYAVLAANMVGFVLGITLAYIETHRSTYVKK